MSKDLRNACAATAEGCARCEVSGGRRQGIKKHLLLAPLDTDADAALVRALDASGMTYKRRGPVFILTNVCRDLSALSARLDEHLAASLRERVKGVFSDDEGDSPDALIGACFHAEPLVEMFEQAELSWVRAALDEGWLFSMFHPIVDARSKAVFGYEALVRARRPDTNEIIGAGELMYASERLNLKHQLDQQARCCAIRNAGALGISDAHYFVNFLPSTIYDPAVCLRSTMAAVEESGIAMNRLVFEVVETERVLDMPRLKSIVAYYREKGASIALDDISSGFSSLQYLADLLPDYVKIDADLVTGAAESAAARHTLDSVVGLAKKLNAKVIAEGIESRLQLDVCVESGVDYLQGFLFALPANPPQAVARELLESAGRAA